MGSGKTFLGSKLAQKLKVDFLDTDEMIAKAQDMSVAQIFEMHGETHFRTLEKELLASINPSKQFVMATGGGLPCWNGLMEELKTLGTTVYLKNSPERLLTNLKGQTQKRPLLASMSERELFDAISARLDQREGIYSQAEIILEEEDQTIESLIHRLRLHQKN